MLQPIVLSLQPGLRYEELADPACYFARHRTQPLHWVNHGCDALPKQLEIVEACVGDEQKRREDGKEREAREQARTAFEERGRRVFHAATSAVREPVREGNALKQEACGGRDSR